MIAIIEPEGEGGAIRSPEYTCKHTAFYACGCSKKGKDATQLHLICPKHPDGEILSIHSVTTYVWLDKTLVNEKGAKGPQEPNGPPEGINET